MGKRKQRTDASAEVDQTTEAVDATAKDDGEESKPEQEQPGRENNHMRTIEAAEKILAAQKRWREKNPEKVKKYQKTWRDKNQDKVRAAHKKYQEKHPEKVKVWHKKSRDKQRDMINMVKKLKAEGKLPLNGNGHALPDEPVEVEQEQKEA
jgi:hypothetical protein